MTEIRNFILTFSAELKAQRKNYFGRFSSIITLMLWPFLSLLTIYFTYQSFDISLLKQYGIYDTSSLLVFITSGMLVYNCFWSMVQGAGQIQYDRKSGMLETILISPANMMGFVYGRAFGGIIHNSWMFTVLCVFIFCMNTHFSWQMLIAYIFIFLLLSAAGTVFGGFITALFLSSRDTGIIFTLCDQPMQFLSGTAFPILCLPLWVRFISYCLPTTYLIEMFRSVAGEGIIPLKLVAGLLVVSAFLIWLTSRILNKIMKKIREADSSVLY